MRDFLSHLGKDAATADSNHPALYRPIRSLMRASWKTTSGGIAAIVGGLTGFVFGYKNGTLSAELCTAYVSSILSGIGLLCARDNNVSSVDVGIQGVTTNVRGEAVITPAGPLASDETKEKFGVATNQIT